MCVCVLLPLCHIFICLSFYICWSIYLYNLIYWTCYCYFSGKNMIILWIERKIYKPQKIKNAPYIYLCNFNLGHRDVAILSLACTFQCCIVWLLKMLNDILLILYCSNINNKIMVWKTGVQSQVETYQRL